MRQLTLLVVLPLLACGRQAALSGAITCGSGTHEVDAVCVSNVRCGPGTHEVDGTCATDRSCGVGTTLMGTECVGLGVTCGTGTALQGNTCVAEAVRCGPGTELSGMECLPTGATVTCGPGTSLQGTQCRPTGATITCGAGTTLQGSTCVANGQTVTCGAGTTLQGNQCIGTQNVTCGPGTQLQTNQCVAVGNPNYEVRVPVRTVPADGFSKIPVFAIGRLAAGAPSNEPVILTVSPSYAGTVSPSAFALGTLGSTSYFTPCVSTSPACSGTFSINLALASAPSVVVATTGTLTLQVPQGVGSPAPCLLNTNVVFFDGDSGDYIHPGVDTITLGRWSNQSSANTVRISVDPMQTSQGLWWNLEFSTSKLGQPLGINVYTGAERAPFAAPGHPGIDVGGSGRGCNTITGAFQVHSLQWQGTTLKDFTATFEQHCEGGAPALRGCVHFQQ